MEFKFKNLFGIDASDIKSTCIIAPFLPKSMLQKLNITQGFPGSPYACFQHEQFTLIKTLIGSLFTGDAVLGLQNTPCEKIILIGACGSLDETRCPIGSIVTPTSCYAFESFTKMLAGNFSNTENIKISQDTNFSDSPSMKPVACASVGSIFLEHQYLNKLHELNIDIVEMECASVFAAAASIQRRAQALLYVTDIIGKTSPYEVINQNDKAQIDRAQNEITDILLKIT